MHKTNWTYKYIMPAEGETEGDKDPVHFIMGKWIKLKAKIFLCKSKGAKKIHILLLIIKLFFVEKKYYWFLLHT
jgi:hypothetical protein